MTWDTHRAVKELQAVDFTEQQAEKIVEIHILSQNEILGRFDRLEANLENRFEKIDQKFEKIDQRFEKFEEKIDQKFEKLEKKIESKFTGMAVWIGVATTWLTLMISVVAFFK